MLRWKRKGKAFKGLEKRQGREWKGETGKAGKGQES